jgi:SAM-dependent methyltransferase
LLVAFKDLFSRQSTDYARFRPTYPPALYGWLAAESPGRSLAVDVGAGNGQATAALAVHFDRVIGVDPSEAQLAKAEPVAGVELRRGSAEATGVAPSSADLLVAAQAFHWFDQATFFAEVRRVVRPGGVLAIWCYGLSSITPEIDAVVHELYEDRLGPYWEPERRLVEVGYRTVAFPFPELSVPAFAMELTWTPDHLMGYLGTWSPLKRYRDEKGEDPLPAIASKLEQAWGDAEERKVSWPLSLRAFRV